ncbi:hypothetical protein BC830DRAFT_40403 [Chytriomyces sp. MP71]|nr:hypothetical protein BC830DRAFT_40403 [Chytriomyces sp. MP71]
MIGSVAGKETRSDRIFESARIGQPQRRSYISSTITRYPMTPSCKYDQTFEIHQNDHCFANNHRVVFVGDSQIRETYNLLQKRLSGDLTPTQQTVKFPPTRYVFGDKQGPHLEVSWIKDEYLKHLLHNLTVLDSYDKLVFEVGHWPFTIAREGGHWKMGQYKALLKAIFSALSSYNAERIARGLKSLQAVFTGASTARRDGGPQIASV